MRSQLPILRSLSKLRPTAASCWLVESKLSASIVSARSQEDNFNLSRSVMEM